MNEIKFTLPPWHNDAHDILTMKRGQEKRMSQGLIVIETLRAISGGKPTRDQLQKFSKLRRKRFIQILKHLLEIESVVRSGSGTKHDPYQLQSPFARLSNWKEMLPMCPVCTRE